jgi:hypothetical protein
MNSIGGANAVIKGIASRNLTLKTQATTTVLKVTTSHFGSSVDVSGFRSGLFLVKTTANASAAPKLYLQVALDTTTFVTYATLHPDMTTTANNRFTFVGYLPDTCRTMLKPATTTTHLRYTITSQVWAGV